MIPYLFKKIKLKNSEYSTIIKYNIKNQGRKFKMFFVKNALLLIAGFILLIKGADFFVDGSSSIAKLLKIPTVIIGLTIVAIGTSAPELSVSITSSLAGKNALSISNVIGSNIFNLLMVIGVSAAIKPMKSSRNIMRKEFPMMIGVTVIMVVMLFVCKAIKGGYGITRTEGIILFLLFIAFMVYMVVSAIKNKTEATEEIKNRGLLVSIIFVVGGIAAIKFGGDFVVDSASKIAIKFGMTETLVGLTIVALGTSLPELVTSIVAIKKGENDLALGNVVGSNMCNVLLILGVAGSISAIKLSDLAGNEAIIDGIFMVVISVITFIFARNKEEV